MNRINVGTAPAPAPQPIAILDERLDAMAYNLARLLRIVLKMEPRSDEEPAPLPLGLLEDDDEN